jgi:transmembrane sensor
MNKNYFIKLLRKYLKGESTKNEQIFVENYYELFQNESDILDTLSAQEKKAFKTTLKEEIWSNINKSEETDKQVRPINMRHVKLAAAATIAVIFISSLYFLLKTPAPKTLKPVATSITPEHKKNHVILLPDSSVVILSGDSKLKYPSSFDHLKTREVSLEGEAFFDIKHITLKPFIVHTGNLETKVLGTAFNIKAFPDEDNITVTVRRGRVSVNDQNKILGIITPNEQITYAKSKIKSSIQTVKNESYLTWRQEDLLIDNLTISGAAKLLEDRYNVKIIIIDNPDVESLRFTTTFSKNEPLDEVLSSICLFYGLGYTYNKEKSLVTLDLK